MSMHSIFRCCDSRKVAIKQLQTKEELHHVKEKAHDKQEGD